MWFLCLIIPCGVQVYRKRNDERIKELIEEYDDAKESDDGPNVTTTNIINNTMVVNQQVMAPTYTMDGQMVM